MRELNLENIVGYARESVNRVIAAAMILEQQQRHNTVVSDLVHSSCRLLTQNINLAYMCGDGLYADDKSLINIGEVLDSVIEEAELILVPSERDIDFKGAEFTDAARICPKAFIVVVMNLLQNAFLYSPKESAVRVTLEESESGREAVVTVKNTVGEKDREQRSGLGLMLAEKIVEWHGGVFETFETDGEFTARISLPTVKPGAAEFNSPVFDYSDYVSERFKPVALFLDEVVERRFS